MGFMKWTVASILAVLLGRSCGLGDLNVSDEPVDGGRATAAEAACPIEAADPSSGPAAALEDCLQQAAVARDGAARAALLRTGAALAQATLQPDLAASLRLLAAAQGDADALALWAEPEMALPPAGFTEKEPEMARYEALREAARAGSTVAAPALQRWRAARLPDAWSLARGEQLLQLLEGRWQDVPDQRGDRMYLAALATGLQEGCPFQRPLFASVAFQRDLERYTAPLRAQAQGRLFQGALGMAGDAAWAVARFGQGALQGEPVAALERLYRDGAQLHRRLNTAAAVGSQSGAADAIGLLSQLGGDCSQPDAQRLVRSLGALLTARAPLAPTDEGATAPAAPDAAGDAVGPIPLTAAAAPGRARAPTAGAMLERAGDSLRQGQLGLALLQRDQAVRADPALADAPIARDIDAAAQREADLLERGLEAARRRELAAVRDSLHALQALDHASAAALLLTVHANAALARAGDAQRLHWFRVGDHPPS